MKTKKTTKTKKAKDTVELKIRLSRDDHQHVASLCAERGMTPSQGLAQLLRDEMSVGSFGLIWEE